LSEVRDSRCSGRTASLRAECAGSLGEEVEVEQIGGDAGRERRSASDDGPTVLSRLVAAAIRADEALSRMDIERHDCVFSLWVRTTPLPDDDVVRAAAQVVRATVVRERVDDGGSTRIAVRSRGRLDAEEVVDFYRRFVVGRRSRPPGSDVSEIVAAALAPFTAALAMVPANAGWYALDVPYRNASGELWDIIYVDVSASFAGQLAVIHLGWSD
jgi:hypothetical protein